MSQTVVKNNRLVYIDVAKGILILLVVLGHVLAGSNIVTKVMIRAINSFHVPAFFAISGFLVKEESVRKCSFLDFLIKKIKRLFLPYLVFELFAAIIQTLFLMPPSVDIWGIVTNILTGRCYAFADWFLVALFFSEIILYWIVKYLSPRWHIPLLIAFIALAVYLPEPNWFLANCRRVFAALGFILFGMRGKKLLKMDSWWIFVCALAAFLLGIVFNTGAPSIALRLFENPFLFVICGCSGTYITLFLSKRIATLPWIERLLTQCGNASIVIMGTHQNILVCYVILYGHWTKIPTKLLLLFLIAIFEVAIIFLCRKVVPSWVGVKRKPSKDKEHSCTPT